MRTLTCLLLVGLIVGSLALHSQKQKALRKHQNTLQGSPSGSKKSHEGLKTEERGSKKSSWDKTSKGDGEEMSLEDFIKLLEHSAHELHNERGDLFDTLLDGEAAAHALDGAFKHVDVNEDGNVDLHELYDAMQKHFQEIGLRPLNGDSLWLFFNHYDKDHSGTLNLDEFRRGGWIVMWQELNATDEQIENLYHFIHFLREVQKDIEEHGGEQPHGKGKDPRDHGKPDSASEAEKKATQGTEKKMMFNQHYDGEPGPIPADGEPGPAHHGPHHGPADGEHPPAHHGPAADGEFAPGPHHGSHSHPPPHHFAQHSHPSHPSHPPSHPSHPPSHPNTPSTPSTPSDGEHPHPPHHFAQGGPSKSSKSSKSSGSHEDGEHKKPHKKHTTDEF